MTRDRKRTAARYPALWTVLVAVLLGSAMPCTAHDEELPTPIIIDTDMGVDDVVALAMALQSPDLDIAALIASEGVAESATAAKRLAGMLELFNRPHIPLFQAPASISEALPKCRPWAEAIIDKALPSEVIVTSQLINPRAYVVEGHRSTVLVLGPLTQMASAFRAHPEIAAHMARIVASCDPSNEESWNIAFDREAAARVRTAGVPMVFVTPGKAGRKPDAWYPGGRAIGQGTSLADALLDRMLVDDDARGHYLGSLSQFHDELAVLFLVRPDLFEEVSPGVVQPINQHEVAGTIASLLSRGRQQKNRVVFVDGPLPADALQADVRARREAILANNGEDEWFAQLLLNELHEHLGAYSIIGVKMGLRAAELLNAPQHSMEVVSSAPSSQPVSCLNDGLLVATGSTPGRGLFTHNPGPPGTVEASFEYNGRWLTLRLKDEHRARIRAAIQDLLTRHTLEEDGYWEGVRELGLHVWQDWHRRDLFEVKSLHTMTPDQPQGRE